MQAPSARVKICGYTYLQKVEEEILANKLAPG